MAQADGRDLDPAKRQRLRDLQWGLSKAYPHFLPLGTLLFRCEHCAHVYPLNHFARNHQRYYGIKTLCRACLRERRPRERHAPDPEVIEKRCRYCRTVWPIDKFWINRSQPDGYSPGCRACAQVRRESAVADHHHDDVLVARREQTVRLCGELGIDYPGYDIMRCRQCGEVRPLAEFSNDWSYATRKKPRCLDCHAAESATQRGESR